jgi:osmotically-inducible protein OsmY
MGSLRSVFALGAIAVALGCTPTDAKLNDRVAAELRQEGFLVPEIRVRTVDRIVTLEGVVADEGQRQRIERAVLRVEGVAGIDDHLTVHGPVELTGANIATTPEERELKAEVRRRLDDKHLGDIAVEVHGDVVRLQGFVAPHVHDAALRIVGDVVGDRRRVDDALVIAPAPRP